MNNKGQSILSEYVMIFFVVIAAVVAMTLFVQRSFEARIHDARNFAIDSLMDNKVCDVNCLLATGGNITHEYEPYYAQMASIVGHNEEVNSGITNGSAQETGSKYLRSSNEVTNTISTSVQLPPQCANGGC